MENDGVHTSGPGWEKSYLPVPGLERSCIKRILNVSVSVASNKTYKETTGKPIKWIKCFSQILLRIIFDKVAIIVGLSQGFPGVKDLQLIKCVKPN